MNNLKNKNEDIMNERLKIFNQYKNLAYSISYKYYSVNKEDNNDLNQIALIELWECTNRYNKEKSCFSTYATNCITMKIKQSLIEKNGIAKKSGSSIFYTILFILKNKEKKYDELLSNIKKEKWYKLDTVSFYALYNNLLSPQVSVESLFCNYNDKNNIDINDNTIDLENNVIDKDYTDYLLKKIEKRIRGGNNKKNSDIYMDWLKNKVYDRKCTLKQLGEKYGISKQRVDQIVNRMNEFVRSILYKEV